MVGAAVVAVVALVVVAAAVVFLGSSSGTVADEEETAPTTTFPTEWDPRIELIAEWVADERDLDFDHPVEVELQSEEDYIADAGAAGEAVDEEDLAEAEDFVAVLRGLGLVSGEVDLPAASRDLAGEGTLAYYSPEEERIYVRGTELTPAVRVTLAHELTHTLQDQRFDLGRLGDPDFDRAGPLRAVAEGDAQRTEDAYVVDQLTATERDAYEEETAMDTDEASAALETVPPALVTFTAASYILGQAYIDHLVATDGDEAVDAALEDPPTEEELLVPSIRGTASTDTARVDLDAPEGAEVLDEDEFGPLARYLLWPPHLL